MPEVIVVTGLPRSGTSMLMRMLQAGGVSLLTDERRLPDEHNPHGYFEYEPVKAIGYDVSWVALAAGRAVKVVVPLLVHLPAGYAYAVLFMRRNLHSVFRSQERMLLQRGGEPAHADDWICRLAALEQEAEAWCTATANCRTLRLSHEFTTEHPHRTCEEIQSFLGRSLDVQRMAGSVAKVSSADAGCA
jgi:hypothetical protein